MSLDPAASPWPGVVASVAVCLWIAVIGGPIAYAVFQHRPRLVWPYYAPIVGVVAVLLTTNLAAYVAPGAPVAWFGLVLPSILGGTIVWRAGALRQGSRRLAISVGTLFLVAIGVYVLVFATRMHGTGDAPGWHYALVSRLARGAFPPVTPYGVDAGVGYHYGPDMLAASIVSTTGALAWTALDALAALLVVALVFAAAGLAFDVGAPLPLALGVGATVGLFDGGGYLGYRTGYLEDLTFLNLSPRSQLPILWSGLLQRPLAIGCVVLVAATLHAGTSGRQALMLAAAAGVLALGDASVMIFASSALALVGVARLVRVRGSGASLPRRSAGGRRVACRTCRRPRVGCAVRARRHGWNATSGVGTGPRRVAGISAGGASAAENWNSPTRGDWLICGLPSTKLGPGIAGNRGRTRATGSRAIAVAVRVA